MYESQRKKLEQLKQEILRRVRQARQDLSSSHSADWSEQVTERENEEVLEALVREGEDELVQIDRALIKVDQGRYGLCASCGELINPKRLDALPYTTLCISCASKN